MEVFLGGIYYIKNIINNKIYIGLSNNVNNRIKRHLYNLQNKKHSNRHLQTSFNKYGKNNFEIGILEYCKDDFLCEKEKYYISLYNSHDNIFGYNKTLGGEFGKVSEEANQNRIKKLKLQTISLEMRNRISNTLKNRKQPIDVINKRRLSCRKYSDEIEQTIIKMYIIDNKTKDFISTKLNIKKNYYLFNFKKT